MAGVVQNHKKPSVDFAPPWETPSFLLLHTMYAYFLHSKAARLLEYIEEDY
jgi:hypothetical protein